MLTDAARARLGQCEFRTLLLLARAASGTNHAAYRAWLRRRERAVATRLWRRGLVEVWYRQSNVEGRGLLGPFYTLTRDGWRLVETVKARQPRKVKTMNIRDYDPTQGQAFQGDVAIIPMPKDIEIARHDEIKPVDGRLILQEGEVTGHHHAIVLERPDATANAARPVKTSRTAEKLMADAEAGRIVVPTARLFRDPEAVAELVRRGLLTRGDLAVGCLVVEGNSFVVGHEEHDGIRLPEGNYYIGRQIESAGAEERIVAD